VKEKREPSCYLGCSANRALRNFSRMRFSALARDVAALLEQIEATNVFGNEFKHRTLWDEYCHEVQVREDGSQEIPCCASFSSAMFAVMGTIDGSEKELLNIGAKWHVEEGQKESANMVGIVDPVHGNRT
jgi:hypothetical protein